MVRVYCHGMDLFHAVSSWPQQHSHQDGTTLCPSRPMLCPSHRPLTARAVLLLAVLVFPLCFKEMVLGFWQVAL